MKKMNICKKMMFVFLMIAVMAGIGIGGKVYAATAKAIAIEENMVIYEGEERFLDIRNMGGDGKVTITSSDSKVAGVTSTGKISGISAGKAVVTVKLQLKNKQSVVKINVRVGSVGLGTSSKLCKESVVKSGNKKMPVLAFHKVVRVGESTNMAFSDIDVNKVRIDFKSGDEKVAKVARNGKITAIKTGKTAITATVKQDGNKYVFKEIIHVRKSVNSVSVGKKEVNQYFAHSAFIGNSLGLGLKSYVESSQGAGSLGKAQLIVRGSYSFINDTSTSSSSDQFKLQYNGSICRAKDAVSYAGVSDVFIQMGTNDLWEKPDAACNRYISYLKEIRKQNPGVRIFIESTTPVYSEKGNLNNSNINRFNSLIEAYCDKTSDMYYIDISSNMKDGYGKLKSQYVSDNYVHLTFAAYDSWTNDVRNYVKRLIYSETMAKNAVAKAENTHLTASYENAVTLVNNLKDGRQKRFLKRRLKDVKKYL